jgi:hypothetical protein
MSNFENLVEILFNNNSIKGATGAAEFYRAVGKCGSRLAVVKVKSC